MLLKINDTVWITTIRAVNSAARILITAFLLAESEVYGLTTSIIAGYMLFSYRFVYQSVGLHSTTRYKLRQVLRLSKLYIIISIFILLMAIGIGFITYLDHEKIRLILIIIILSTICAFINEIVRFSAKGLINRENLAKFETLRVAIEVSIFAGLLLSYSYGINSSFPPIISLLAVIGTALFYLTFKAKPRTRKRFLSFIKTKLRYAKINDNWNWSIFLLVSGLLYSLDRILITALHSNPLSYISAITICTPVVGAISFLYIWTTRTKICFRTRLILGYITLIFAYIALYTLVSVTNLKPIYDYNVLNYWTSFIKQNFFFLLLLSALYLSRDFLSQLTFETSTGVSIYLITPAFLVFLLLVNNNFNWQYVLIAPVFIYTLLTLGYLAYVKSTSSIKHDR